MAARYIQSADNFQPKDCRFSFFLKQQQELFKKNIKI